MGKTNPSSAAERVSALGQNLRAESALLHALRALSGLDFVVLKGGLLTRRIYGDLALRVSGDNDILVRARDASAALEKLTAAGYRAAPRVDAVRSLRRTGRAELWLGGDTELVTLDLHVRAFDPRLFDEDEAFLWSSLVEAELHGHSVWVFDDALSLAHLAGHALSHFASPEHLEVLAEGWARLGPGVAPEQLREAARRTLGRAAFDFAVLLSRRGEGDPPLPWAPSPRARLMAQLAHLARWSERGVSARALLTTILARPRSAPALVRSALYPGRDELYARYGEGSIHRLWLRHLSYRLRGG